MGVLVLRRASSPNSRSVPVDMGESVVRPSSSPDKWRLELLLAYDRWDGVNAKSALRSRMTESNMAALVAREHEGCRGSSKAE